VVIRVGRSAGSGFEIKDFFVFAAYGEAALRGRCALGFHFEMLRFLFKERVLPAVAPSVFAHARR
jgi:hypothetical protein